MKFNLTLLAAALAVAACAPKAGKTTQIVGQFTEDAPETVRIVLGETVDTTVTVTDGRFQVAIPTDLCDVAYVETDYMPVSFIADGSKITVDPMAGTAVSFWYSLNFSTTSSKYFWAASSSSPNSAILAR